MQKDINKTSERFLSIGEVAKTLSVDYQVIRTLIVTNRLKASKIGWQWRIKLSDLNAYIESRATCSITQ